MITGIGTWVEKIELAERGDLDRLVYNAVAVGCSWMAVKCGDSYSRPAWDDSAAELLRLCADTSADDKNFKLDLYTWSNSKPTNWPAQAQLICNQQSKGVKGHIIKFPNEWTNNVKEAASFMQSLKEKLDPEFILGAHFSHNYSSHINFPYQQICKSADFYCSDVDWIRYGKSFNECSELFDKHAQYMQQAFAKESKPYIPVCHSSVPLNDFVDFVQKYYAGGSFAYWETATEDSFMKLADIALKYDMGSDEEFIIPEVPVSDEDVASNIKDFDKE